MSEIKFRAWDKHNKEMFKVEVIDFVNKTVWGHNDHEIAFDLVELMQSTGLKDTSGLDIYEGDFVRYEDCVLLIKWGEGMAGFYYDIVVQRDKSIVSHDIRLYRSEEIFSIIGNIYANPKLPEASK